MSCDNVHGTEHFKTYLYILKHASLDTQYLQGIYRMYFTRPDFTEHTQGLA